VCVCVSGHVYVVYEDTNLYNDMGMTRRYYKEVIYEDVLSVPIIQNAYKSYRVSIWGESRNAPSRLRAKFWCRVGVGQ